MRTFSIVLCQHLPAAMFLGVALESCAVAEEQAMASRPVDKGQYHLFNPTPLDQMRPLSADRPDKTDSAFTVDAGHFQVEMDFANLSYDRYNPEHADVRVLSYEVAPMNLKLGLLNNVDMQLTLSPYRWERTEEKTKGTVRWRSGFGDITPRVKINVVGNDRGRFALALMPLVKLPTNQDGLGNHSVEGGLKVPYWFDVPGWDVSLMTEFDFRRDETTSGYHPEFVNSISVGHRVVGKLSYYVEFFGQVGTERGSDWVGTVDTWFTYQLSGNLRLDAGVYIGVTRAAEDWHPFVGATWRY